MSHNSQFPQPAPDNIEVIESWQHVQILTRGSSLKKLIQATFLSYWGYSWGQAQHFDFCGNRFCPWSHIICFRNIDNIDNVYHENVKCLLMSFQTESRLGMSVKMSDYDGILMSSSSHCLDQQPIREKMNSSTVKYTIENLNWYLSMHCLQAGYCLVWWWDAMF